MAKKTKTIKKKKLPFEHASAYLHYPILKSKDGAVWTGSSGYASFKEARKSVSTAEAKFVGTKVEELNFLRPTGKGSK
jgi:hypothetical protein